MKRQKVLQVTAAPGGSAPSASRKRGRKKKGDPATDAGTSPSSTSGLSQEELDQLETDDSLKRPLLLVFALHVLAIAGLLIFTWTNLDTPEDMVGDPSDDDLYVQQDPAGRGNDRDSRESASRLPGVSQQRIVHTVQPSELLPSIARRYDVSLTELARLNNMGPSDFPEIGQELIIPGSGSGGDVLYDDDDDENNREEEALENSEDFLEVIDAAEPAQPVGNPLFDALADEPAEAEEVDLEEISAEQQQEEETDENETQSAPESEPAEYVVQPGDTLWKISRQYGTTPDKLMELNSIDDPTRVRSGQKLKIR